MNETKSWMSADKMWLAGHYYLHITEIPADSNGSNHPLPPRSTYSQHEIWPEIIFKWGIFIALIFFCNILFWLNEPRLTECVVLCEILQVVLFIKWDVRHVRVQTLFVIQIPSRLQVKGNGILGWSSSAELSWVCWENWDSFPSISAASPEEAPLF